MPAATRLADALRPVDGGAQRAHDLRATIHAPSLDSAGSIGRSAHPASVSEHPAQHLCPSAESGISEGPGHSPNDHPTTIDSSASGPSGGQLTNRRLRVSGRRVAGPRGRPGPGRAGGAEVGVDRGGGRPALGDRPDDQRRAAVHVAGDEDARRRRSASPVRTSTVAPGCGASPAASSSGPSSVPSKPIASSTRSAGSSRSVPGTGVDDPAGRRAGHGHLGDPYRPHLPGAVVHELLHRHGEDALAALLVGRVVAQDPRPGRPRVAVVVACRDGGSG